MSHWEEEEREEESDNPFDRVMGRNIENALWYLRPVKTDAAVTHWNTKQMRALRNQVINQIPLNDSLEKMGAEAYDREIDRMARSGYREAIKNNEFPSLTEAEEGKLIEAIKRGIVSGLNIWNKPNDPPTSGGPVR